MTELFMENKRVDLSEGLSHLLSYMVDDIKDFQHKQSNVSKTIIVPGTANNNKLFGSIFDVNIANQYDEANPNVNTNFNASVSASILLFQDRLQVFRGTLRLLEIIILDGSVEYEVVLFGELGGLVSAIGNKKLEDFDFTAYNHAFTASGITASWDNLNGSGYCYPLIDVGTVSQNKIDYDIRAFRPSLFVKEYIDKMFQDADYTYESDLFNTDRFKKLIVPYNQRALRSAEYRLVDATRTDEYEVVSNAITQANLSFQTFLGAQFTANLDKSEFTYTGTDTITVTISFRIEGRWVASFAPIYLRLRKNNVDVVPGTIKVLDVSSAGSQPYAWEKTVQITLAQNDYIALWYYWGDTPVGSINSAWASVSTLTVDSLTPVYDDIDIGDTVDFNVCIPKNVLQRDFLSSIIKLFNLYVYEDPVYKKKLFIKPYIDFYDLNPSGVVDWTYKVDRSRAIKLKPMSELNSRYYDFKFKEDSDFYNDQHKKKYSESYGSYIYDSEFEFANEKEDVELIFSPSILVGYTGVDKVLTTIFKKSSGVEETTDFNIRILQAKKITGVTSWDILDGVSVLSSQTAYLYAGHYDDPDAPANDIHFGVPAELYFLLATGAINVTQFNVYWSSYMAEITDKDSKLMTCYMKLDNSDIFSLDFSKLVYVDGSYWRINKIIDWNAIDPDVCQVELLKVINLLY